MEKNYFYNMLSEEESKRLTYHSTVSDFLNFIAGYGEIIALSDYKKHITYSQLSENTAKRRTVFNDNAISDNAVIGIYGKNSIDVVELFLAATTSGRIALVLPASISIKALPTIAEKFNIEALFCNDEYIPILDTDKFRVLPISAVSEKKTPANPSVDSKTPAAIFFTGGTTGTPKGALLNHAALMRGAFNGIFMTGGVMNKRYYAMLPFSHVFGMIRGMLSCLYTGSEVFIGSSINGAFRELPSVKPTTLVLVPGLVELLLSVAQKKGIQSLGGSLETIISGAANVPPRLMESFSEFGINLLAGYGLTETANLVSGNADTAKKPDSVGIVYPGTETKVVNGELWVKGDSIFSGYYGDYGATQECFCDGWFRTGDLVRFDDEGYMYITGRIKNLIVLSNGENVSPEAIEELFYKEPIVKDCLVSEETLNGKQVLGIEIIPLLSDSENISEDELTKMLKATADKINSTLPDFMRIRKVTIRKEDFPRTGSLKIARKIK